MSTSAIDVPPKGGFSFDLCRRNDMLAKKGLKSPSYLKTGTTIVGLIFQVISCIQGVAQAHLSFDCQILFFHSIILQTSIGTISNVWKISCSFLCNLSSLFCLSVQRNWPFLASINSSTYNEVWGCESTLIRLVRSNVPFKNFKCNLGVYRKLYFFMSSTFLLVL